MSATLYKTAVYSNADWKITTTNTRTGLCLSGGGSRALSAGLGQLIGLKSLTISNNDSALDAIDYISSVSGGTWLTSIFTYSSNRNLDDLLGTYTPPETLKENNIGDLPSGSIGHAPGKLSFTGMLEILHQEIGFENILHYPEVRKWIWPVIIGELILRPYGLYEGQMIGTKSEMALFPKRFFTLDEAHMQTAIKAIGGNGTGNSDLKTSDFYFHQNGPCPIFNTNIKLNFSQSDSLLLPVQATPIAVGATGSVSDGINSLTANGGVESFAFSSEFQSQSGSDAMVEVNRRYSLVDIVACSSAFFAEIVGSKIAAPISAYKAGLNAASNTDKRYLGISETSILKDLASLVPQYNYWPAGVEDPVNHNTGFADGGVLDNTGLLGMLARSDAKRIIVCYNGENPLGNNENISVEGSDQKVALISTDIPVLFGYQPSPVNGTYVKFSEHTPADLNYLRAAQVFENSEFAPLVHALFVAGNHQKSPAYAYTPSLNVCDNISAGIYNRGQVDVLWFYNDYASDWCSAISTSSWELAENIRLGRYVPTSDFYNFPNYDTGLQIELNATQVNSLAQYQAWVINQAADQIQSLLKQ